MKMRVSLTICMVSLLIGGCATAPLSKEKISAIDTISVDSKISAPIVAKFHGGASNFENMGWLGSAINETDRPFDVVLTEFITKNGIDVREILYQQFSEKLKSTILREKIRGEGGYKFKLEIEKYGLGKGWGFSNNMRPSLHVTASILNPQDELIWQRKELVGGITEELPIKTLEEWMRDPKELQAAFNEAAKAVSSLLLQGYENR